MATKRAWLSKLAKLKSEPRPLTPAECDELILLLGGTVRPRQRPEIRVFGMNRRQLNWGAVASVVFAFLENAEQLERFEAELLAADNEDDRRFLLARVEALRPISARTRAQAERMASKWFAERGAVLMQKQIANELSALRQKAGLRRLGLAEWRVLNAARK